VTPAVPDPVLAQIAKDMGERGWHARRRPGPPPTQFQVLGERASGTNLVRTLIAGAWTIEQTEALGWKHGFPSMIAIPKALLVICVVRDPITWATSLFTRPWHSSARLQALGFSEFLRAPWQTVVDRPRQFQDIPGKMAVRGRILQADRHPITGRPFANLFALRTAKAHALLGMAHRGCHVAFVKLEPVQADPRRFVESFGRTFGLSPSARGYRPVARRLGNRFKPAVQDRPPPPNPWPRSDIDFALLALDKDTEAVLGYDLDAIARQYAAQS